MKNIRKWIFYIIATFMLCLSMISFMPVQKVKADDTYITLEIFSKYIAHEVSVAASGGSYLDGLKATGIIKEGEFSSPDINITRGDALIILNRADEFLSGTQLDPALINITIDKRISDISKVDEGKRADVAKAYLKGFMKGYPNGAYCTDRDLKLTKKITKTGALSCVKMLKDKGLRAKISPDGQLIRTSNLPKNAKTYPYILASFPNAYYEKDRVFENKIIYDNINYCYVKYKRGVDYYYPIDLDKYSPSWCKGSFAEFMSQKQNDWLEKALSYTNHVFNVDYRTINDTWVQDMVKLSTYYDSVHSEWYQGRLDRYVEYMKEAATVVKSREISADLSSLYTFEGDIYLRVRVKYQIVSTKVPSKIDVDSYIEKDPYKALLFSTGRVDMRGFKLNKPVEEYFDVELSGAWYDDETLAISVMEININD